MTSEEFLKIRLADPADEEVLKRRAEQLARSSRVEEERQEGVHALVLSVGGERYAVELPYIWEVLPAAESTPVPGVSDMVRGVIKFRGEVVPLYDLLGIVTGRPQEKEPKGSHVVFGLGQIDFAAAVDGLEPPVRINPETLRDSVSSPGDRGYSYVQGFTEDGVVVLNMKAILNDESLIVDDET